MKLLILATFLSLAVPTLTAAQTASPGDALPVCSDSSNCPLIPFTQRALGTGLDGVTLAPSDSPTVLLARTSDSALPAFRLMWIDQTPPLSPERTAADFLRGLARPGRFCNSRPIAGSASADGTRGAYDLRCAAGQTQEVQVVLYAVQNAQRTRALILLAPLNNGPALLARGQRVLQGLSQAASAFQRDYAQLRQDCADDSNAQRQIAGCNAVLANDSEGANYSIAFSNRGHALERSGNLTAALADYDRSLAREPSHVVAHINRGRVLSLLGRFDEAHAAIERSLSLENNLWARLERARIYLLQRQGDRALSELDQVIQADSRFADALVERGRLLAERSDHKRAIDDFTAALAVEPDNGAAADGLQKSRANIAASTTPNAQVANTGRFTGQPPVTPSRTDATSPQTPRLGSPPIDGSSPVSPPVAPSMGQTPIGQPPAAALLVPNIGRFTGQQAAAPAPIPPSEVPGPPSAAPTPPLPSAAPSAPASTIQIQTVRGLMRDKPFSLSYPDEFQQSVDGSSELLLDHPQVLFQVSLKIAPAPVGANAQSAAREPAAQVGAGARAAFPDFSLEHRSLVILPAGAAHIYVSTMTSPMGPRPKLRMVVAEFFSEGRRYELTFTIGEDVFASASNAIGFILANFAPSSAQRPCCADPVSLPW